MSATVTLRGWFARLVGPKTVQTDADPFRYRAFLSYRTADEKLAKRLHEKLERYRIPKDLIGKTGERGPVPRQVGRVFRDREEVRTSEDIETIIAQELSKAQDLIVFCTPRAVEPHAWVGREIEIFRDRRPDGKIHAVLGDGEPPGCFPPQLLAQTPDGRVRQPLAADLRPRRKGGQDGESRAIVKLVAGLVGIAFDDLWKRELRRTRQRHMALGIAFSALLSIAGVAAYLVVSGREVLTADHNARGRWQEARTHIETDPLLSLHLMTEAAATAASSRLRDLIWLDHVQRLRATRLLSSWDLTSPSASEGTQRRLKVALSPAGNAAAVWRGGSLSRLDLTNGTIAATTVQLPGVYDDGEFNASGELAVLWTKQGTAHILQTRSGSSTRATVDHGGPINQAGFTPDDRLFFTAGERGDVRLWDVSNGAPRGNAPKADDDRRTSLQKVILGPDGRRGLIITEHRDYFFDNMYYDRTRLWDFAAGTLVAAHNSRQAKPGDKIGTEGVFSQDGESVLTWEKETAWILDARDGAGRKLEMPHPSEKVQGAVFDRSERYVVTWTNRSIIRVWDIASGATVSQLYTPLRFSGDLIGLAIDSEAGTICGWAGDGTIQRWRLKDGHALGRATRPSGREEQRERPRMWQTLPTPVRMDRSDERLLSWVNGRSALLWYPRTGLQAAPAMSHADAIQGAAFTTSDATVLTWSEDGNFRLWSLDKEEVRPSNRVIAATFGIDSTRRGGLSEDAVDMDPMRVLAWRDDSVVAVWDVVNGSAIRAPVSVKESASLLFKDRRDRKRDDDDNKKSALGLAFDREGKHVAIYGAQTPEFSGAVWNLENSQTVAKLDGSSRVTFNREGTHFAVWQPTGAVTLYTSSDGKAVTGELKLAEPRPRFTGNYNNEKWTVDGTQTARRKDAIDQIENIVINSTGDRLAVIYLDAEEDDPTVRLWAVDQGRYIGPPFGPVHGLQFTPQGHRLVVWRKKYAGGEPRAREVVALVDARSGKPISDFEIAMEKWDPARLFDASGRWLFGTSAVWSTETGAKVRPDIRGGVAMGRHALFFADTGNVEVMDGVSGQPTGKVLSHGKDFKTALVSSDFALTIGEKTMKLWSLKTGKQVGSELLLGDREWVRGFIASRDGSHVLTWDLSEQVKLREVKSGNQVGASMQHTGLLNGVAWSERLGLVGTWGSDAAKLWDAQSGENIHFDVGFGEEGAQGAFFETGQPRIVVWKDGFGNEWNFSELLVVPNAESLRRQAAVLTGVEYVRESGELRVLTTEQWKALARPSSRRQ